MKGWDVALALYAVRTIGTQGRNMSMSAAFNAPTTAMRHMLDINLFGVASDRYNARNTYRTEYTPEKRWAAGVGVAAGAAVPVLAMNHWAKPGVLLRQGATAWKAQAFQVPGVTGGGTRAAALAAGSAAAIGVGAVGVRKLQELVTDDGHLGSVGSLGGMVAGYAAGHAGARLASGAGGRFAPYVAPLVGGALAIGGGIAGHKLGQGAEVGPGHIGQPIANTTETATGFPGTGRDFVRGGFIAFNEAGPTSQGISFSNTWHGREAYADQYSKAERGGSMSANLAAATILGGGALTAGARLLRGIDQTKVGSSIAERGMLAHQVFERPAGQMLTGLANGSTRSAQLGRAGIGVAAGGVALGAIAHAGYGLSENGEHPVRGAVAGAGMGVLGMAAYKAGMKSGFGASFGKAQPLMNAVTVATLLSGLSAARMPVQQFISESKVAWDKHGSPSAGTKYGAMAAGAAAGAVGGRAVARSFSAKPAIAIGAMAAGAAAGGAAGLGISPTLPEPGKAALGAGTGAAVLGLATLGLTHGRPGAAQRMLKMGAVGGLAGGMGSAVLATQDAPAATDITGGNTV